MKRFIIFLLTLLLTGCSLFDEASINNIRELPQTQESTGFKDSSFSVSYLDVGQADAALVQCNGHYMMIDGGNKEDSSYIYSILKNNNITHFDIVVGTHAHEDHIGGLPALFNYATSDITLCPVTNYDSDAFNDFKKYANENGNGLTVPNKGDTYTLGSAIITIIGVNETEETNDTSIILKIQYGNTSFLFTGDAERDAEISVIDQEYDLSSTVLKVGHHGSDTSTTYPFIREVMPQYAVISVGEDNQYGHPSKECFDDYFQKFTWKEEPFQILSVKENDDGTLTVKMRKKYNNNAFLESASE